jgi:exonuclease VII small subunit
MAIYHLSVKNVSRGQGRDDKSRCVTAAAAYRSGQAIEDKRSGQVFDYTRRSGVEHTELVLPQGAPDWARSRSELWNRVEQHEKRRDSRLAREFEVALPTELDAAQRQVLARQFAQELVERYGIAVDVCIHRPHRHGDDRNHHAHILTSTRTLGPDGWGAKIKALDGPTGRQEVEHCRERWEALSNQALERAGHAVRIDRRRLDVQREEALERGELDRAAALDREPTVHLGPDASALERRGVALECRERHTERHEAKRQCRDIDRDRIRLARERRQLEAQLHELGAQPQEQSSQVKPAIVLEQTIAQVDDQAAQLEAAELAEQRQEQPAPAPELEHQVELPEEALPEQPELEHGDQKAPAAVQDLKEQEVVPAVEPAQVEQPELEVRTSPAKPLEPTPQELEERERAQFRTKLKDLTIRQLEQIEKQERPQPVKALLAADQAVQRDQLALRSAETAALQAQEPLRGAQKALQEAEAGVEAWHQQNRLWSWVHRLRLGQAGDLEALQAALAQRSAELEKATAELERCAALQKQAQERLEKTEARVLPLAEAQHTRQRERHAVVLSVLEERRQQREQLKPQSPEQLIAQHPQMLQASKAIADREAWERALGQERQELLHKLQGKRQAIEGWRTQRPKRAWLHDKGLTHSKALGKLESEARTLEGQMQERERSQKAARAQLKKLQEARTELHGELQPWGQAEHQKQVQRFQQWRERHEPEQLHEERQREQQRQQRETQQRKQERGRGRGR